MKKTTVASALAALALALAVPAFAGGDHCGSAKTSNATASAGGSCDYGKKSENASTAWAGAWMHRDASGAVKVTEVARNSPAARAGLKSGDVVLAVNGYNLADARSREMCESKAECVAGATVTYTVQRGRTTKDMQVKLEKMPADAANRLASKGAKFDPVFAAAIVSAR
jgi:S1-C subfamily serine protease